MNTKAAVLTFNRLIAWMVVFNLLVTLLVGPVSAHAEAESFIIQGNDIHLVAQLVESYGGNVTSQLELIHGVGALISPAVFVVYLFGEMGVAGNIGKEDGDVPALAGGFQTGAPEAFEQIGAHHGA